MSKPPHVFKNYSNIQSMESGGKFSKSSFNTIIFYHNFAIIYYCNYDNNVQM